MMKVWISFLMLSVWTLQSPAAQSPPKESARVAGPAERPTAAVVVRASEAGAALDSHLMKGGGTDDTVLLQKILNRAQKGSPIHIIIDGPALVSGLTVYGNTTMECTAGGGLYLKDNSSGAIIRNANRSRGAIVDEHIEIRGCFLNGNRKGQPRSHGPAHLALRYVQEADGTFRNGLQFYGVQYLTIENVTLWNVHGFHSQISNAKFITIRDVLVNSAIPSFPGEASLAEQKEWTRKYWSNDDGLHFNGPIQYLTIDGVKLHTWDDGISLVASGEYGLDDITQGNEMGPYVGQGPITDVTISNVMFIDSHRGIRLLSSKQRIDRILIQNVTGTIRERFIVLGHLSSPGRGNFGAITFGNVNTHCLPHPTWEELRGSEWLAKLPDKDRASILAEEAELPLVALNSPVENLQLNHFVTSAIDRRPLIRVGSDAAIGMMNVGLSIHDPNARAVPLKLMGRIERLKLSLDWPGETPIKYEGGTIGRLEWIGAGSICPSCPALAAKSRIRCSDGSCYGLLSAAEQNRLNLGISKLYVPTRVDRSRRDDGS